MVKALVSPAKKKKTRPTVLLAGGAGFIGIHLTDHLISQGAQVICVDNLATSDKSRIAPFSASPWFSFVQADLNKAIPDEVGQIDYVFHLAGHETYLYAEESINLDSLLTNSLATYNLLEFTVKQNAKFLLASSLDIYRGISSRSSLRHYFGVSEYDQKEFSHAEAQRYAESLVWEYYKRHNLDVRVARLGEVYGPGMDFRSGGSLGKLVESTLKKEDLIVYGEGLEKEYYLFVKDAVDGLAKALFRENTAGKIFPLADLHTVTPLELAYTFKKKFTRPGTKVVFKPALGGFATTELTEDTVTFPELDWKPTTSIDQGIKETLESFGWGVGKQSEKPEASEDLDIAKVKDLKTKLDRVHGVIKRGLQPVPRAIKVPGLPIIKPRLDKLSINFKFGSGWQTTLLIFLAVFIPIWLVLLGPIFGALYHGFFVKKLTSNLLDSPSFFAYSESADVVSSLQSHVVSTMDDLDKLVWIASVVGREANLMETQKFLDITVLGLDAMGSSLEAAPFLIDRLYAISPAVETPSSDFYVDAQYALQNLEQAQDRLNLATAQFKLLDYDNMPLFLVKYVEIADEYLPQMYRGLVSVRSFTEALPDVLGLYEPKKYLLLFQNSSELRPTGGFLGSYALLDFEKGKLQNMKVDDIYNPDGLLDEQNVQIAPPEALKKYLGVESLRIRDANWSVDFTQSAVQVRNLFLQATGVETDAVIAIDLEFIQKLLEVLDGVYIASYGEEITAENLFERAEFHSEAGYFEGSSQKRAFLSLLGEQLFNDVLSMDKSLFAGLFGAVGSSLDEKHLLAYFPSGDLARLLAQNNWDGRVMESDGDYLMVVDANVGSTKSNYYVRRNIKYSIQETNREGELKALLTLNYVHTGTSNAWPGGPYKAYTRVLVPYKTSLLKATQTRADLEQRVLDITETIDIGEESGKTVFAIPFTLQAGESASFELEYILPPEVGGFPTRKEYYLLVQKQPGTHADPLTLEFTAPFGQRVVYATDSSKMSESLASWRGDLLTNVELRVGVE